MIKPRPFRNLHSAKERAVVWRLFVRLGHLMTRNYFPGRSYGETTQVRLVLLHVMLPTVEGVRVPNVSELARLMGMSRPTILRRLEELIELGYIERVGDRYMATERCNISQHQVEREVREIEQACRALVES